jgi:hypothetical protein
MGVEVFSDRVRRHPTDHRQCFPPTTVGGEEDGSPFCSAIDHQLPLEARNRATPSVRDRVHVRGFC